MEITTVGTALEIANKAWKALEAVRERAQQSKDATLKASIGELYDDFLSLKAIIVRLTDENSELRRTQKEAKPVIRQVGEANYYYLGDEGPYCQPCFDCNHKLVNLTPQQNYARGIGRKCMVCNNVFFEQTRSAPNVRIKSYWEE